MFMRLTRLEFIMFSARKLFLLTSILYCELNRYECMHFEGQTLHGQLGERFLRFVRRRPTLRVLRGVPRHSIRR